MKAISDLFQDLPGFPALAETAHELKRPLFAVGGAVRDLILRREVHDLDVATGGSLDEAARILSSKLGARAIPVGRFPKQVFRFVLPGFFIDLVPLEGETIENDLSRRDLTINAMAIEIKPNQGQANIVDPRGGLSDLKNKTAKFNSEAVILNDPLRLLRLFRFCAVLSFAPHPESLDLVKKHSQLITNAAGERIREELFKLLAVPESHETIKLMLEYGLLTALVPELKHLRTSNQNAYHHLNVLEHTFLAFHFLEKIMAAPEAYFPEFASELRGYLANENRPSLLKLAILLHDLGKPLTLSEDETGRIHFYKHEVVGADMAVQIARRLRLSKAEENYIRFIIRHHLLPFHLMTAETNRKLRPRGIYRFGRSAGPDLWGLLLHALADAMATQGPASRDRGGIPGLVGFFDRLVREITKQRVKVPRLVTGNDLMMHFGLSPSPLIGRLLSSIEEAQALGQIDNKKEALGLAAKLLKR